MRFIALIGTLFITLSSCSQSVYYGYPIDNRELKKGDKIILNLPVYTDSKFTKLEEFEALIKLLKSNEKSNVKLEINVFYGDAESSLGVSNSLSNSLREILQYKTTLHNYEVISKGRDNPIFLNKKDENYKLYNTRMEVYIE